MQIDVRVTPRSSRSKAEFRDSTLHVWVMAAPTDGQANESVRRLIADVFEVPVSRVVLVRGDKNRNKVFRIDSDEAALLAKIETLRARGAS